MIGLDTRRDNCPLIFVRRAHNVLKTIQKPRSRKFSKVTQIPTTEGDPNMHHPRSLEDSLNVFGFSDALQRIGTKTTQCLYRLPGV